MDRPTDYNEHKTRPLVPSTANSAIAALAADQDESHIHRAAKLN